MEAAKEEIFITDWWFVLTCLGVAQLSLRGRSRQCGTVRSPTVWQLALQPDGLAAHPNLSLCCVQRPFQEGWQQKRMLQINSLLVSLHGNACNRTEAPPELKMWWLGGLIRSVNRCKPEGHGCLSACKGAGMLNNPLVMGSCMGSSFQPLLTALGSLVPAMRASCGCVLLVCS